MMLKKSLRENKYVAAQMDKYAPYSGRNYLCVPEPKVVKTVEEITGIREVVSLTVQM
jgi:hypothetical protein